MPAGVALPFWLGSPPMEALEIATLAEELGYSELWMGEYLHFDAMALAGSVARLTKRITITVGPLAIGLRDPVLLAMGVASIGVLGGRAARLAIGASTPVVVKKWHGRKWGGEATQTEEAVTLIRQVLHGDRTDHRGAGFHSEGFRSLLAPQQAHITVAGLSPRMISVADRVADRLVLNFVSPAFVAKTVASTRRPVAVWVVTAVEPTEDGLRQASHQIAMYLRAPGYRDVLAQAGLGAVIEAARQGVSLSGLAARITPDHLNSIAAVGELGEVRKALDAYRDAGAELIVVPVTAGDDGGRRTLQALAPTSF